MVRELTQGDLTEAWRLLSIVTGRESATKAASSVFEADKRNAEATFASAEGRAKTNYNKAVTTARGKLDETISEAEVVLGKRGKEASAATEALAAHQAKVKEETGSEPQLPVAVSGGRTAL